MEHTMDTYKLYNYRWRQSYENRHHTKFSSYFFNIKLRNINLILNRPFDQSMNIPDNISSESIHMIINNFVGESNTINNFNYTRICR